jgi:hypothetical protein
MWRILHSARLASIPATRASTSVVDRSVATADLRSAPHDNRDGRRFRFEGLLFRLGVSVTSDAEEKVPTGRRADSL